MSDRARGRALQQMAARDRVVRGFQDVLEVTDDFQDALDAVGRDYASMRRTLLSVGEHELAQRMREWRDRDNERLRFALGRQWQERQAS